MTEGADFGVGARGLTTVPATRLPIRSTALAVLGLAIVSVVSFPSVGGARETRPLEVHAAVLTPDGTDGYEFATGSRSATVVAPTRNAGANLRTVFWSGAARPQRDALTCATWINATSDGVQQGSAVRIDAKAGGFVRAVTVTKNIYLNGFWIFNVHVWESATNEMRRIASVDLRETFASPGSAPPAVPVARALPWRLCTRVAGSTLEFKAWRLTELEPVWGDPAHGATVQLPPDAPTQGYAGWYVGHLEPGATTSFIDLVTGDGSPRSR